MIARALPLSGPYDPTELPQLAGLTGLQDPFVFTAIDTQTSHDGGDDLIFGEDGEDIILGQQGADRVFGGNDDDDIFGGHNLENGHDGDDLIDGGSDHGSDDRLVDESDNDVIVGDNASILRRGDSVSPRMRVLSEDEDIIYDTSDLVQVTGDPQINPTMVAERNVEERDVVLFNHSLATEMTATETFGNDYIAGGHDDDVIFGQLGNDVIQGDGSVTMELAPAGSGTGHELETLDAVPLVVSFDGSSNSVVDEETDTLNIPGHGLVTGQSVVYRQDGTNVGGLMDGTTYEVTVDGDVIRLTLRVKASRDSDQLLDVIPSFELATDGDDYIEGNGGADVIFGNLGQDDIIGGSSMLFGLQLEVTPTTVSTTHELVKVDTSTVMFDGLGSR